MMVKCLKELRKTKMERTIETKSKDFALDGAGVSPFGYSAETVRAMTCF